jgi:hypothetical protein
MKILFPLKFLKLHRVQTQSEHGIEVRHFGQRQEILPVTLVFRVQRQGLTQKLDPLMGVTQLAA